MYDVIIPFRHKGSNVLLYTLLKIATSKINVDFNVNSTLIFNVSEPWKNLDFAWFSTLISTSCIPSPRTLIFNVDFLRLANLRLGHWFSTLIFNVLQNFASDVDFQRWFSTSCKPSPQTLIFNVDFQRLAKLRLGRWFSTLIFNVLQTFASDVDFQRWLQRLANLCLERWFSTFCQPSPWTLIFNVL